MRHMTKIDIFSGFLGAGKTTLIKKLIADSYKGEKLVLIENEFGEIGIDGGFLQDAGIEITEMNSGCICCSLVGDFREALHQVLEQFSPDRIIIEPSGVGKLSDVIRAVSSVATDDVKLNAFTTVVDAGKCKMYMKNFGEFFNDQVEHAGTVIMSHADSVSADKLSSAVALVREKNPTAVIVTTPIFQLDGETLLSAIEREDTLAAAIEHLKQEHEDEEHEHHHHHHDDDDDDEHEHHHHEHEHHHHHHHDHEGGEVEEYGIGTYVYYARRPMDLNRFDWFVSKRWPKGIIRTKGMCYFTDEFDICYLFEQAGKQMSLKNAGQWYATMPENQLANMLRSDPTLAADWDETYGDRMQKLVFIGQNLDKAYIKQELDACLAD